MITNIDRQPSLPSLQCWNVTILTTISLARWSPWRNLGRQLSLWPWIHTGEYQVPSSKYKVLGSLDWWVQSTKFQVPWIHTGEYKVPITNTKYWIHWIHTGEYKVSSTWVPRIYSTRLQNTKFQVPWIHTRVQSSKYQYQVPSTGYPGYTLVSTKYLSTLVTDGKNKVPKLHTGNYHGWQ